MPPKPRICHCRSQGCADAERKGTLTDQILKGRYLSEMEYRSHQRQEKASIRSGSGPLQVESNGSVLSPLPPSPLCSESPTPNILKSVSNHAVHMATPVMLQVSPAVSPQTETLYQSLSPNLKHPLPTCSVTKPQSVESPIEGNLLADPINHPDREPHQGVAQSHIMQLILDCRFDFHSWLRSDISSDGLIFEETAILEPTLSTRHPPLRMDVISNVQFIEYEEIMLGLLDRIEKINTGADKDSGIAKRNLFSSIEDEIHRVRGLKLQAWKVQVKSTVITLPAPQSGPFREIDTGTQVVCILISLPNKMCGAKGHTL